jgi:hypothetical protein
MIIKRLRDRLYGRRSPFGETVAPEHQLHASTLEEKVVQEIYCRTVRSEDVAKLPANDPRRDEQEGCAGYFRVALSVNMNGSWYLVCPKCKHKHLRRIENGHIVTRGRLAGEAIEEIEVPLSAWSPEPITRVLAAEREKHRTKPRRWDAVTIRSLDDIQPEFRLQHSWMQNYWPNLPQKEKTFKE